MTTGDWIGLVGIVVAVMVGVPGYFVIRNRHMTKQMQSVGDGGLGIQAGRDVKADIKK